MMGKSTAKTTYLQSLHRPFHQQLKAVKWVCMFIDMQDQQLQRSIFNIKFYLYLIEKLHREYKILELKELNGVPSSQSINNVYKYFKEVKKDTELEVIEAILKSSRKSIVEKQVYSTYKAATYYVNMAKDKLGVITNDNQLDIKGIELLSMKSNFFKLSLEEKKFFFKRLVEVDSLMILTIPLFKKLAVKYKKEDYIETLLDFLIKYYNIKYSYYTKTSLGNYSTVRNYWIRSLDLMDSNMNIKKQYLDIINSDDEYKATYTDIVNNFKDYENTHFKNKSKYDKFKEIFEIKYEDNIRKGNADGGYVNLYDIKEGMRMSDVAFENFLNEYNYNETKIRSIFFANLVNSIDRRRRFEVKGVPVLKIKIKKH